jgi:hypothetical protein
MTMRTIAIAHVIVSLLLFGCWCEVCGDARFTVVVRVAECEEEHS